MHDEATIRRVDTAIHATGLLVRAGAYALVSAIATRYTFGQAILTGLFVGDAIATVAQAVWQPRHAIVQALAELGVLALVWLCIRGDLAWPQDPAMRAILGLSAFGVFATRMGGGVLTRFGPSESGFGH